MGACVYRRYLPARAPRAASREMFFPRRFSARRAYRSSRGLGLFFSSFDANPPSSSFAFVGGDVRALDAVRASHRRSDAPKHPPASLAARGAATDPFSATTTRISADAAACTSERRIASGAPRGARGDAASAMVFPRPAPNPDARGGDDVALGCASARSRDESSSARSASARARRETGRVRRADTPARRRAPERSPPRSASPRGRVSSRRPRSPRTSPRTPSRDR